MSSENAEHAERLAGATTAAEQLAALRREFGLRLRTLAIATGTDERTVRDWRINPIRDVYAARIGWLVKVVLDLAANMDAIETDGYLSDPAHAEVLDLIARDEGDVALALVRGRP